MAISQECLEAADSATVTRSEHSIAVMNVQSVAEAAALAGAMVLANRTDKPNPGATGARDVARKASSGPASAVHHAPWSATGRMRTAEAWAIRASGLGVAGATELVATELFWS